MISVIIPVGPYEANKRWLLECIHSIEMQTMQPHDIIIINDGAIEYKNWTDSYPIDKSSSMWEYYTAYNFPMRLGISHAFNAGVALAETECVFMLGSDDTLEPTCLERCWEAYNKTNQADGYYSVPIKYMDTGEIQTAPCNAAMVTRNFWKMTGGFPIESAIGMGDSIFLSICIAHKLPVYWVGALTNDEETPLYNYRRHLDIHTYKIGKYFGILDELRNILTRDWIPNDNVDITRGS